MIQIRKSVIKRLKCKRTRTQRYLKLFFFLTLFWWDWTQERVINIVYCNISNRNKTERACLCKQLSHNIFLQVEKNTSSNSLLQQAILPTDNRSKHQIHKKSFWELTYDPHSCSFKSNIMPETIFFHLFLCIWVLDTKKNILAFSSIGRSEEH